MQKRVTMREVAEAAGVHFTTVSRALRNHPALPEQTRLRIQQLAMQMGYSPDPVLSALNSYRVSQRRIVSYQGTIAWLDGLPAPHVPRKECTLTRIHDGAKERAQQLGYKLESFWLGKKTPQEIRQIDRKFKARGVRNLIVSSLFQAVTDLDFSWDHYSAVSISLSLANRHICTVANDHHANIVLIMRKLRALGYTRIGMLLDERLLDITDRRWLSGYLTERDYLPAKDRVETLHFKDDSDISDTRMRTWYRKNRPDAIITDAAFSRKRIEPALGIKAPRDIGFAFPSIYENDTTAGIIENSYGVGKAAVEQLVRMDHSNERGLLETPPRIYINGSWKDGNTVRSHPGA